jgi:HAD superfamily hydrolase (TIGR01549 family)
MPQIDAIIFDLYGTLLHLSDRSLHKEMPAILGASRRDWLALMRGELLTRPFESHHAFADHVARALGATDDGRIAACRESVDREIASVVPYEGVRSLLAFLQRRGFRLGLISNCASPHREPLFDLGLDTHFAAMTFSCDAGKSKPDPSLYADLARRLGSDPSNILFVGDSHWNDVVAPAEGGMMTVGLRTAGRDGRIEQIADLGLLALSGERPFEPLIGAGSRIVVGGSAATVTAVEPVPDGRQGRYNLVFAATAERDGGERVELFVKRFLLPETAHVEEFACRIQKLCGLPTCDTAVAGGGEPLLVVSCAPGEKYAGEMDASVARDIGRHLVFAYLFSNADMRPRNAFLVRNGGDASLTMIDLEHCFFNLALDVTGVGDPRDPRQIDALGREELEARTKKRVLTSRTTHRTRREFFDVPPERDDLIRAFREGFVEAYASMAARRDEICDTLAARVYADPPLVIGTHGYRRAMAQYDVEDVRLRMMQEPGEAFDFCY